MLETQSRRKLSEGADDDIKALQVFTGNRKDILLNYPYLFVFNFFLVKDKTGDLMASFNEFLSNQAAGLTARADNRNLHMITCLYSFALMRSRV